MKIASAIRKRQVLTFTYHGPHQSAEARCGNESFSTTSLAIKEGEHKCLR